jgi:tRNA-binding protein
VAEVTYQDFDKLEIRVGRIINVEDFEKARKPAYKLWIDFGEFGVKRSSAQITEHYERADLLGQLVIAVTNFPPKKIADFESEVLVLGVPDEESNVVLICPDFDVPVGGRVF